MGMRERFATAGVKKQDVVPRLRSGSVIDGIYDEVKELGSGSFGRVCLVQDTFFGVNRVCKFVNIRNMPRFTLDLMKREVEVLRSLDHPSIVRLFAHVEDANRSELVLVLEFINGIDGGQLIEQAREPLAEGLVARLMFQLMGALAYCHQRGVTHRDIKPENMMILYQKDGDQPDCKLIDFGLSALQSDGMNDYVGTPKFMAPEVHRRSMYTSKADIWSAGATAANLLSMEQPFEPPYWRIGQYANFGEVEQRYGRFSAWTSRAEGPRKFVRWMMQPRPGDRPTAEDVLEEDWLEEHRPALRRFPKPIAWSMVGYVQAPPVVRCCLLSIAARIGTADADAIGHAFLGADSDGDGLVSAEDLEEALRSMDGVRWWCDPAARMDVEEFIYAAGLSHEDGISFTELMAACLYAKHETLKDLATQAFHALDEDRDGLVHVKDIRGLFRERDRPFLQTLPQDDAFDVDEWCQSVTDYSSDVIPSSHVTVASTSQAMSSNDEELSSDDDFRARSCATAGSCGFPLFNGCAN